jgi:hypothetical protein
MILKRKKASRGLPDHSLLGDEAKFIAAFEAIVKEATLCLGANKVRDIVGELTKKPRGTQDALNRKLLEAYNSEKAAKGKVNISDLATRLGSALKKDADAIKKQLYRLRRKQDRRVREYADLTERLLNGIYDYSNTMLRPKKISRYRKGSVLGSDI